MKNEIEALKQGDDYPIRILYANEIRKVFAESGRGEIGWGDFIDNIRASLDSMEEVCSVYWPKF